MCGECHVAQAERDTAHMTSEELSAFNEWASEVLGDRDVMSGSYGSVPSYRGACPLWYDRSGYSRGRGYQVYVDRYGNKH